MNSNDKGYLVGLTTGLTLQYLWPDRSAIDIIITVVLTGVFIYAINKIERYFDA